MHHVDAFPFYKDDTLIRFSNTEVLPFRQDSSTMGFQRTQCNHAVWT